MVVNLTIQEILEAKAACEALMTKTFSAKTAFKIVGLIKKLESIENLFNEMKLETIKKYAKKDEDGNVVTETLENGQTYVPVLTEFQEQCMKEISDMLVQRYDIFYTQISIKELEEKNITIKELLPLYHFILESEDSE